MISALLRNPIADRQFRRLVRLGPLWWVGILAIWGVATWALRVQVVKSVPLWMLTGGPVVTFFVTVFTYLMRADLPVVLLLSSILYPRVERTQLRSQLGSSRLGTREILLGELALPILLLAVFNTVAAPIIYPPQMEELASAFGFSRGESIAFVAISSALALLEDFTFCTLAVLIFYYEMHTGRADRLVASAKALSFLLLVTVALSGVGNLAEHFFFFMLTSGSALAVTTSLAAHFLVVLAIEVVLICWLVFRSERRLDQWLHEQEDSE